MVKEVTDKSEFEGIVKGPGLVVVDFFATWCGPCMHIAPFVEELASKYPDVVFIKVDCDKADWTGVRSLPTFRFFVLGNKVDELTGADRSGLEGKVVQHRASAPVPFSNSKGNVLGAPSDVSAPGNAREARLRAFDHIGKKNPNASNSESSNAGGSSILREATKIALAAEGDSDEGLATAIAMSLESLPPSPPKATATTSSESSAPTSSSAAAQAAQDAKDQAECEAEVDALNNEWGDEMVPVPVNESFLATMIEMGISDVRARKALVHGNSVEGALEWYAAHQDDPDIDQPYMVRKADTMPKPELTPEEKAARQAAVKELIKKRKEERMKKEKADEIAREKERRERGQKMEETQEQREAMMRKREAEKIKREKMEAAKERERLRLEIARDKEARRANKGVLPSVLGVDGYNPSAPQYDVKADGSHPAPSPAPAPASQPQSEKKTTAPISTGGAPAAKVQKSAPSSTTSSSSNLTPEQKIDTAIQTIMRYRTGGDGGNALKLLLTFVKNIVENPDEPKYRTINAESAAYKSKLAPLVGPAALLKAIGFEKLEEGKLKLEGPIGPIVHSTFEKLTQAEQTYRQMNP